MRMALAEKEMGRGGRQMDRQTEKTATEMLTDRDRQLAGLKEKDKHRATGKKKNRTRKINSFYGHCLE